MPQSSTSFTQVPSPTHSPAHAAVAYTVSNLTEYTWHDLGQEFFCKAGCRALQALQDG